jgi:hypothetical protein
MQRYYFFTATSHEAVKYKSDPEAIAAAQADGQTIRVERASDSETIWKKTE